MTNIVICCDGTGNEYGKNNTNLYPEVTFGYQAISIDEKRKDFPICMWDEGGSRGPFIEQVWSLVSTRMWVAGTMKEDYPISPCNGC